MITMFFFFIYIFNSHIRLNWTPHLYPAKMLEILIFPTIFPILGFDLPSLRSSPTSPPLHTHHTHRLSPSSYDPTHSLSLLSLSVSFSICISLSLSLHILSLHSLCLSLLSLSICPYSLSLSVSLSVSFSTLSLSVSLYLTLSLLSLSLSLSVSLYYLCLSLCLFLYPPFPYPKNFNTLNIFLLHFRTTLFFLFFIYRLLIPPLLSISLSHSHKHKHSFRPFPKTQFSLHPLATVSTISSSYIPRSRHSRPTLENLLQSSLTSTKYYLHPPPPLLIFPLFSPPPPSSRTAILQQNTISPPPPPCRSIPSPPSYPRASLVSLLPRSPPLFILPPSYPGSHWLGGLPLTVTPGLGVMPSPGPSCPTHRPDPISRGSTVPYWP